MDHEYFMSQALELAREAQADGDVPVGLSLIHISSGVWTIQEDSRATISGGRVRK